MSLQPAQQAAAPSGLEQKWWLPHVVLLCCQLAFAVMHISSHAALEHIPPLPYSAMRVTLALPLLFAGARIKASCPATSHVGVAGQAVLRMSASHTWTHAALSRFRIVSSSSIDATVLACVPLQPLLVCSLDVKGGEVFGTCDCNWSYSCSSVDMVVNALSPFVFLQEPTFRLTLRDVPWCMALGVLGIGIPQSLVFVGNNLVGAAYAPIMVPTTPVYVALLSAAFGMEAFNRYKVPSRS